MATLEVTRGRAVWLQDAYRRTKNLKLPWLSIFIVAILLICAAFAPLLARHDPTLISMLDAKLAPGENPTYPLGTDIMGRDMLSRLIYGARTSVFISLVALGTGAFVGTVIVVLMGAGIESIILAVVLTVWARFARMIRGEVLSIKNMDFVTFARIAGVAMPVIIWRHIFPNTVNTLMVITSLQVGQVILLEASLSFLGLGLPPGDPAWGIMVAEGRNVILEVWWLALLPGLAITIVVLAFNFFGDWLRDTLDPKLRRA